MGKQADKKLKHRRFEQKRGNARRRANTAADSFLRDAGSKAAAYIKTAPTADLKALEASLAEAIAEAAANPERVAAANHMARQLFAAPLSKNNHAASPTRPGEFPAVEAKTTAAYAALRATVPTACQHLHLDSPLGAACVDETDTVVCPYCLDDHMRNDHTAEWDRTCSECGGIDMRGISVVNTLPVMGMPVRFDNEVRVFVAPVMLTGLGLCNPCRLAAGRKRARAGGGSGV